MLLFFCSTSMYWTPLDAETVQHKPDRLTPVPVPHLSLKVAQSCPTLWPHELCPWSSPGKNTGVGSHSLFHRIFLTQRSNLCLLYCRQILYHLSHQGSPRMDPVFTLLSIPSATALAHVSSADLQNCSIWSHVAIQIKFSKKSWWHRKMLMISHWANKTGTSNIEVNKTVWNL